MKKMLMLASVASMIDQFNMSNIEILHKLGYEVHVACNFEKGSTCSVEKIQELKKKLDDMNVKYFQIDFSRNVLMLNEVLKSYRQVLELCKTERYNFIHCHSPIGGVVGRLAGHATKTKVIYTAHGFHFFKGAPLINWMIYYPIEKWLSRYTEVLITINQEDYQRAKTFKAKNVEYIPGVGVDTETIKNVKVNKKKKREELGIPENAFLILSVGELNLNKNHQIIIKAIAQIKNTDIYYVICGKGNEKENLEKLSQELGVYEYIKMPGFRSDVVEVCKVSDIFAFPSMREGLPVSLMEAMASGLPVVCSSIRGNTDLIVDGQGGYLVSPNDSKLFADRIVSLLQNTGKAKRMGKHNEELMEQFTIKKVKEKMKTIYMSI